MIIDTFAEDTTWTIVGAEPRAGTYSDLTEIWTGVLEPLDAVLVAATAVEHAEGARSTSATHR